MKRRILSAALALSLCAGLTVPGFAAGDQPSSWAKAAVEEAVAKNYVPGEIRSNYTAPITRAEFCALAARTYESFMGREITQRKTFTDTTDVNVEKMAGLEVISGMGDGTFAPEQKLTREQAASILKNLAGVMERGIPMEGVPQADFTDYGSVSKWARGAVDVIRAAGIMNGDEARRFQPKGSYTREQSIITVAKLPTLYSNKPHTWDGGKVERQASCGTEGSRVYTCTRCGETRTERIPALEHSLQPAPARPATCTAPGASRQVCTRCGKVVEQKIPALGHQRDIDGRCTRCFRYLDDGFPLTPREQDSAVATRYLSVWERTGYDKEKEAVELYVTFMDIDQYVTTPAAQVDVTIINSLGQQVYQGRHKITPRDYENYRGYTRAPVLIKTSAMTPGDSSTGTIYYHVTIPGYRNWDEKSIPITKGLALTPAAGGALDGRSIQELAQQAEDYRLTAAVTGSMSGVKLSNISMSTFLYQQQGYLDASAMRSYNDSVKSMREGARSTWKSLTEKMIPIYLRSEAFDEVRTQAEIMARCYKEVADMGDSLSYGDLFTQAQVDRLKALYEELETARHIHEPLLQALAGK